MKYFVKMVAILAILLSVSKVNAESIYENFNDTFGPTAYGTEVTTQEDGWVYFQLKRETTAGHFFEGASAITLQTTASYTGRVGYLQTPEKSGGVGLVSFWGKMRYTINNTNLPAIKLELQTSEDGKSFKTVHTFEIPAKNNINFARYSFLVNDANAKYVRLQPPPTNTYSTQNMSVEINIDELIVSDEATSADIELISSNIKSELNVKSTGSILLKGTDAQGTVSFSLRKADSEFALTSTTATAAQVNEGYNLPVEFTPVVRYLSYDTLVVKLSGMPDMIFPITGLGLERNIAEGFNSNDIPSSNGTFSYEGWEIVNGSKLPSNPYEGAAMLTVRTSLISPEKVGGVGDISFYCRTQYAGDLLTFTVSVSDDGEEWEELDEVVANSFDFVRYHKKVDNADTKYVKLEMPEGNTVQLLVDCFVITGNNQRMPLTTIPVVIVDNKTAPHAFNVPIAFSDISKQIDFSITEQPEVVLGKTSITAAEAQGTYQLPMTFTPGENKTFGSTTLTISGGGMYFSEKASVLVYQSQESLFSDFNAEWGSNYTGTYFTDQGWQVIYGARNTNNVAFGGGANVSLYNASSLISPALHSGIGSIQFFARTTSATNLSDMKVSVSPDGKNWEQKQVYLMNSSDHKPYEIVINDATMKYVRVDVTPRAGITNSYVHIDNFTVTKNGTPLSKLILEVEPFFASPSGVEQTVNVSIKGENITSDLNIKLAGGTIFSLGNLTTITAAQINNKTFTFPITFLPKDDLYFTDELVFSGESFSFDQTFPIQGYVLKELLYQGFENTFTTIKTAYSMVDGWYIYKGIRSTSTTYVHQGIGCLGLSPITSAEADDVPYIISPPKSGGVGIIQFYYKVASVTSPVEVLVHTYKDKTGEPTLIGTFSATSTTNTLYEATVNDPNAKYVEITVVKPATGTRSLYIDELIVTANGKGVPVVEAPDKIDLYGYKGEVITSQVELSFKNIEREISVSLEKGDDFEINMTKITPVDNEAKATVTVAYTVDAEGKYKEDNLILASEGLLQPVKIPIGGIPLNHTLYQNFEATGWGATEGSHSLEGWTMVYGVRTTIMSYVEGTAGLQLKVSTTKKGMVTAPIKIPGIKEISFSYYSTNVNVNYFVEVSEDGEEWEEVVQSATEAYKKTAISVEVDNRLARYARIRLDAVSSYDYSFYVDEIKIIGMPYVRLAGEIETIETSVPLTIPVKVAGLLEEEAKISMAMDENSPFSLSKTVITPEDLANDAVLTLELAFAADKTGEYADAIFITDKTGELYYITIPVTVNYTKKEVLLVDPVEAVATSKVPEDIAISLKGHATEDLSLTLKGTNMSNFTLSKTTITPEELKEDVSFIATFTATESGKYEATISVSDSETEYLSIPLSVDYSKPYIAQLGKVEPVHTYAVPVVIPISVGGHIINDVSVSMTGADAARFTPSKTTLTPAEVKEEASFNVSFTADASGVYNAVVVIFDNETEYLQIPVSVTFDKPYIALAEAIAPVQTNKSPVTIPVKVEGFLQENASIKIEGENTAAFTCLETAITPTQLEGEEVVHTFYVRFNSLDGGTYKADVVLAGATVEYLRIPLTVTFNSPYINGEKLIKFCDFETNESFMDWKTFDLDGMALSIFFSEPKAWYWNHEVGTADPESNSMMAATSVFASNQPDDITPANDWLFSTPLAIPATGSYGVSWDARSLMDDWKEDYEVRIIEDAVLSKLEAGFTEETPLVAASAAFVENSDLVFAVYQEKGTWTTHNIDLTNYNGKTVRVVWRYISANNHTICLDNFRYYSKTLGAQYTSLPDVVEYTQVPRFATEATLPSMKAVLNNNGTATLSNVSAAMKILDSDGKAVFTQIFDIPSLAVNTPYTIEADKSFDVMEGAHYYTLDVVAAADCQMNIRTHLHAGAVLSDTIYARDNGVIDGGIYSSSAGFRVGQKFPVKTDSYLSSVSFALTKGTTSRTVKVHLYQLVDNERQLMETIDNIVVKQSVEEVYTAFFPKRIKLEAGNTYFIALESNDGESLYLARTTNRVNSIAAYYTTNAAKWIELDDSYTLFIRMNVYEDGGVGIRPVADKSNVKVYFTEPGDLNIVGAQPGETITVYDLNAQELYHSSVKTERDFISLRLQKGIYIIKIGNKSWKLMN